MGKPLDLSLPIHSGCRIRAYMAALCLGSAVDATRGQEVFQAARTCFRGDLPSQGGHLPSYSVPSKNSGFFARHS